MSDGKVFRCFSCVSRPSRNSGVCVLQRRDPKEHAQAWPKDVREPLARTPLIVYQSRGDGTYTASPLQVLLGAKKNRYLHIHDLIGPTEERPCKDGKQSVFDTLGQLVITAARRFERICGPLGHVTLGHRELLCEAYNRGLDAKLLMEQLHTFCTERCLKHLSELEVGVYPFHLFAPQVELAPLETIAWSRIKTVPDQLPDCYRALVVCPSETAPFILQVCPPLSTQCLVHPIQMQLCGRTGALVLVVIPSQDGVRLSSLLDPGWNARLLADKPLVLDVFRGTSRAGSALKAFRRIVPQHVGETCKVEAAPSFVKAPPTCIPLYTSLRRKNLVPRSFAFWHPARRVVRISSVDPDSQRVMVEWLWKTEAGITVVMGKSECYKTDLTTVDQLGLDYMSTCSLASAELVRKGRVRWSDAKEGTLLISLWRILGERQIKFD